MKRVKAQYVVGLTATPTRKDGHHPIIYMQCGPSRFSMSARTMTETTPFEHRVIPRHTEFQMVTEATASRFMIFTPRSSPTLPATR